MCPDARCRGGRAASAPSRPVSPAPSRPASGAPDRRSAASSALGGQGGIRRDSSAATTSAARLARSRSVRKAKGAIPPSRWQPAQVSRTIGATSRAKLGAAAGVALADPPSSSADAATTSSADATPATATRLRALIAEGYVSSPRVVRAPELAERTAELADRRARRERGTKGRQQVLVRGRDASHLGDRAPRPRSRRARARSACVRSRCARSIAGSRRWSSTCSGSSVVNRLTPTITRSPCSTSRCQRNADSSIWSCTQPASIAATAPPSSSTCSMSPLAIDSSSSVSDSTYQEPPSGSAVSVVPASCMRICCVRSARVAARSVGSASASSKPFVWIDWAPP